MARDMSKTDSSETRDQPTHEQIAQRAYEIFVERGSPGGRDLDHWLEAEDELRSNQSPSRSKIGKTSRRTSTSRQAANH